jgi:hypothetical protein
MSIAIAPTQKKRSNFFKNMNTFLLLFTPPIFFYIAFTLPDTKAAIYLPGSITIYLSIKVLLSIYIISLVAFFIIYRIKFNLLLLRMQAIWQLALAIICFYQFLHTFYEITPAQYHDIQTIVMSKPNMAAILPNYINSKCEMAQANYAQFTRLAKTTHPEIEITHLPIKSASLDNIRKMCAGKINI